jgi:hypothetical protein
MATFKTGNAIRLTATFKNFAGVLADSTTSVLITFYDRDHVQVDQVTIPGGPTNNPSTGFYLYDYTIPSDSPSSVIFEFSGTVDGSPALGRARYSVRFV